MSPRSRSALLLTLIGFLSLPMLVLASPIQYTATILPEENAGGRGLADWNGGGGHAQPIDSTPFRALQADVPRTDGPQDSFSMVSGAWANPNLPDLAVYRLETKGGFMQFGARALHTSLILAQRDPNGIWKILAGVGGGPNDEMAKLVGINDSGQIATASYDAYDSMSGRYTFDISRNSLYDSRTGETTYLDKYWGTIPHYLHAAELVGLDQDGRLLARVQHWQDGAVRPETMLLTPDGLSAAPVPEPSTWAVIALGAAGYAWRRSRRGI